MIYTPIMLRTLYHYWTRVDLCDFDYTPIPPVQIRTIEVHTSDKGVAEGVLGCTEPSYRRVTWTIVIFHTQKFINTRVQGTSVEEACHH
mgnify:CR=1 FL=1